MDRTAVDTYLQERIPGPSVYCHVVDKGVNRTQLGPIGQEMDTKDSQRGLGSPAWREIVKWLEAHWQGLVLTQQWMTADALHPGGGPAAAA